MEVKDSEQLLKATNDWVGKMERVLQTSSPATASRHITSELSRFIEDNPGFLDLLTSPHLLSRLDVKNNVIYTVMCAYIGGSYPDRFSGFLHALTQDDLLPLSYAVLTPTLTKPNIRKAYIDFIKEWESQGNSDSGLDKRKSMASLELEQRLSQTVSHHIRIGLDPSLAKQMVSDLGMALEHGPENMIKMAMEYMPTPVSPSSSEKDFRTSERISEIVQAALDMGLDMSQPLFTLPGGDDAPPTDLFSHIVQSRNTLGIHEDWTSDPLLFVLLDHDANWRPAMDDPEVDPQIKHILRRHPKVRRELLMKVPSPTVRAPVRRGKLG